jgi:hypothetical protein
VHRATERQIRFIRLLMLSSVLVGLVSILSYSLGGSVEVRQLNPIVGAFWDRQQFYFMVGSATVFGILIGILIGRRIATMPEDRTHGSTLALLLGLLLLGPLVHVCAAAARLGATGNSGALAGWLVDYLDYERGRALDRVLIAGVYFLKVAAFGLLAGLALIALALAGSQVVRIGGATEAS